MEHYIQRNTIGEGNGSPLQHSCLENPVDGGAWWAAAYGAAQSRTRLKRLSSSSNSKETHTIDDLICKTEKRRRRRGQTHGHQEKKGEWMKWRID